VAIEEKRVFGDLMSSAPSSLWLTATRE